MDAKPEPAARAFFFDRNRCVRVPHAHCHQCTGSSREWKLCMAFGNDNINARTIHASGIHIKQTWYNIYCTVCVCLEVHHICDLHFRDVRYCARSMRVIFTLYRLLYTIHVQIIIENWSSIGCKSIVNWFACLLKLMQTFYMNDSEICYVLSSNTGCAISLHLSEMQRSRTIIHMQWSGLQFYNYIVNYKMIWMPW